MEQTKEIYLLGRDDGESSRLNEQHSFLMKLLGGPIHQTIPTEKLFTIADVATGTGVWLRDVSVQMKGKTAGPPRYYHGFDISAAQFPSEWGEMKFSTQDVLAPFPSEHQNRYDLVHVRLLVGAIKSSDFNHIVTNLTSLLSTSGKDIHVSISQASLENSLEPGGYLQWVEIDIYSFLSGNTPGGPRFAEMLKLFFDYMAKYGLSDHASEDVCGACKEVGLVNVMRYSYSILDSPALANRVSKYLLDAFAGIMPQVFLRMGDDTNSDLASQMTSDWLQEAKELFEKGLFPGIMFGTVIGQRPA